MTSPHPDEPGSTLGVPARRLWPAPACVTALADVPPDHVVVARYLAIPGADQPRLLLPLRPRRAAAAGLRQTGRRSGLAGRAARAVAAAGLSLGAGDLLRGRTLAVTRPRAAGGPDPTAAPTLEETLAGLLGRRVALVVQLGRPRANRKPVVQVVDEAGRTLAYVKVGIDPLTEQLVAHESAALRTLAAAGTTVVRAPGVLLADDAVLVQEALSPGRRPGEADLALLRTAEDEVAALAAEPAQPLQAAYATGLRARVDALPGGPRRDRSLALVDRLVERHGALRLPLGAWHGDWTPWNLGVDGSRVNAWDWERFGTGVPVGFDRLHYQLQRDLVVHLADPATSVRALLDRADAAAADVTHPAHPAGATTAVACAYLLELAVRYLADGQAEAGARLGAVEHWLLPVVAARLDPPDRPVAAAPSEGNAR